MKSIIVSIAFMCFGFGSIFAGILSFWITDADNFLFGIFWLSIFFLCFNFWAKETPRWLKKVGKVSLLLKNLNELAKFNKVPTSEQEIISRLELNSFDFDNYNYEVAPKNRHSLIGKNLKAVRRIFMRPFLLQTISFVLTFSNANLVTYSILISSEELGIGAKTGWSQILLGASMIIGYACSIPIISKLPRKKTTQLVLGWTLLMGALLVFMSKLNASKPKQLFSLFLCMVGILTPLSFLVTVISNHVIESYPTKLRMVVIGFIGLATKSICSFTGYLNDFSEEMGLNPITLSLGLAIVTLPFTIFLEETNIRKTKEKRMMGDGKRLVVIEENRISPDRIYRKSLV